MDKKETFSPTKLSATDIKVVKEQRERVALLKTLRDNLRSSHPWSGHLIDGDIGQFLLRELKIERNSLNTDQVNRLELDIIQITFENRTKTRELAKMELRKVENILSKLDKLKIEVQELSPDYWIRKAKKIEQHPAFDLTAFQKKLNAHRHLVESELATLGSGKSNIEAVALCLMAIDIFLRWKNDGRKPELLGNTYPESWKSLLLISKSSGPKSKQAAATSELSIFLEGCTDLLGKKHENWRFEYYEPARKAKDEYVSSYPKYRMI